MVTSSDNCGLTVAVGSSVNADNVDDLRYQTMTDNSTIAAAAIDVSTLLLDTHRRIMTSSLALLAVVVFLFA